jgi:hypothetical protein
LQKNLQKQFSFRCSSPNPMRPASFPLKIVPSRLVPTALAQQLFSAHVPYQPGKPAEHAHVCTLKANRLLCVKTTNRKDTFEYLQPQTEAQASPPVVDRYPASPVALPHTMESSKQSIADSSPIPTSNPRHLLHFPSPFPVTVNS